MTREEIREHYPGAVDAVICGEKYGEEQWEGHRQRGDSPQTVLNISKAGSQMGQGMALLMGLPSEALVLGQRVLDQQDHPDFLKYIRAKLGAM